MPPTNSQDTEDNSSALYGSPFDHERADLAIRSSDHKLFLVSRLSIEMASPALQGRLASVDEGHKEDDTGSDLASKRPVLTIPYPSSIVAHLLSTIYPVPLELPNDFNHVALLLTAAEELGMKYSLNVIRHTLSPKQLLQSDPINAYFIACHRGLSEEMRRAAEYSIGHPLKLQEMLLPGDLVHKLHVFHRAWAQRSSTLVDALTEKYGQTCLLSHEHTNERSSVRCTYNRSGWSESLRTSLAQALGEPLAIDRTMLGLNLLSEPMRPTLFGSLSNPDDKTFNFKKLSDICLDVETSAAQVLASIELADLPDPYAFMESNDVLPGSESKVHDKHNRVDADVILRSCDGVLFKTYKAILAMSSSFFEDMFSLPAAADDKVQSPPIVQMTESSTTLESLLSVLMPIRLTVPTTFHEYSLVLAAAQKFDMEYATETLRASASTWLKPSSACSRYGIASRLRLRDEAVTAARELLEYPMTIEYYGEDLRYLNAHALQLLLEYRVMCQQSVRILLEEGDLHNLLWQSLDKPRKVGCKLKSTSADGDVPGWLSMIITAENDDLAGLYRTLSPWNQKFFENAIESHTQRTTPPCTYCMSISPSKLYQDMSKSFREAAVQSVVFPSWD
ncbi:hypothetical protein PENSPDRAFT_757811 [Peniophora sp. CONT]|nr:hypothetical protein PENSPDRAFT_757811 [Peniophora sp. CONT]